MERQLQGIETMYEELAIAAIENVSAADPGCNPRYPAWINTALIAAYHNFARDVSLNAGDAGVIAEKIARNPRLFAALSRRKREVSPVSHVIRCAKTIAFDDAASIAALCAECGDDDAAATLAERRGVLFALSHPERAEAYSNLVRAVSLSPGAALRFAMAKGPTFLNDEPVVAALCESPSCAGEAYALAWKFPRLFPHLEPAAKRLALAAIETPQGIEAMLEKSAESFAALDDDAKHEAALNIARHPCFYTGTRIRLEDIWARADEARRVRDKIAERGWIALFPEAGQKALLSM